MSCSSVCSTMPFLSGSSSAVGAVGGWMWVGDGWVDGWVGGWRDVGEGCMGAGPSSRNSNPKPKKQKCPVPTPPALTGTAQEQQHLTCCLNLCQGGVSQVHGTPLQEAAEIRLGDTACRVECVGVWGGGVRGTEVQTARSMQQRRNIAFGFAGPRPGHPSSREQELPVKQSPPTPPRHRTHRWG